MSTQITPAAQADPITEQTAPDGAELLRRARDLRPLLEAEAAAGESAGKLTQEVEDAFHDQGVFGLWVPKELGGSELSPTDAIEVLAALSYADGAAGWVAMATGMITGTTGAYLGDDAVSELFSGDRLPVVAGHGTRPGKAVPEDGGYRLTGEWNFGSGIQHATHTHSLGIVAGTGEPRIFVTPAEDAVLDRQSWNVLGLRGTGSLDYTITDAHVPEGYTHFAFSKDGRRGDLYRLGVINMAGICHTAWALGVGRRALDELAAMALKKQGRAGQMAESDAFQQGFAEAEAKYRAARALLLEVWNDAEATIYAGRDLTTHQETLVRMALPHVTWTVQEVVMFVYRHGGTTALREGPVQRIVRDMHAATQHITSGPAGQRAVGQQLAGLAEGKQWQIMSLVDAA